MDMLSPIVDFTSNKENGSFMENFNGINNPGFSSESRLNQSGSSNKPTKRSVSETKKNI